MTKRNSGLPRERARTKAGRFTSLAGGNFSWFARRLNQRRQLLLDDLELLLRCSDVELPTQVSDRMTEPQLRELARRREPDMPIVRCVQELHDITLALERMAAKRYGECLLCGTSIERDLLALFPATTLCVACRKATPDDPKVDPEHRN